MIHVYSQSGNKSKVLAKWALSTAAAKTITYFPTEMSDRGKISQGMTVGCRKGKLVIYIYIYSPPAMFPLSIWPIGIIIYLSTLSSRDFTIKISS